MDFMRFNHFWVTPVVSILYHINISEVERFIWTTAHNYTARLRNHLLCRKAGKFEREL